MKGLRLLLAAVSAATLMACEETPSTTVQDTINESGFFAKYDTAAAVIPFPNNLLFQGTADGTLEIPIPAYDATCNNLGEIAVKTALNDLDGFSTVAPITTTFSSAVDVSTLVAGSTVRVFTVTLGGSGEVTSITGELVATDYLVNTSSVNNQVQNAECDTEDSGANKLVITPLKPLAPKTSYLVALSKSIKGLKGNNATADLTYAFAKSTSSLFVASNGDLDDLAFTALKSKVDFNGDGIVDVDVDKSGTVDAADLTAYLASMTSLEGLRLLTNASEFWVKDYTITNDTLSDRTDLDDADIIQSWTFTTQSVGDVLTGLHTKIQSDPAPVSSIYPTAVATSPQDGVIGFVGSDIYVGEITLPYYLNVPADANDSAPLTGSWRGVGDSALTKFNTAVDPASSTPVTVPLLISIPNGTEPGAGWPVVIYQHGITTSRGTMLGIADSLANIGYAVVAIDMPMHGLKGDEDLIGAFKAATAGYSAAIHGGTAIVQERTFDLDVFDAVIGTTDADGDGTIDESGKHFINLTSLLTSRDNVRQAVADLFSLTRALGSMDYNGATVGGIFNTSDVHFVGHSLGAMVGNVFLAHETNVSASVLGMPGGGIAKLLDGSAAFGPEISAGLAANGINKGYAQYEGFLAAAQMVLDSADPINYGTAAATGRSLLMFEVVGDGASNLSDQVIPNNVLSVASTVSAPLSGTDPLVKELGLTHQGTSTTGADLDLVVKFTAGHHGSLLTPNDATDVVDATSAAVLTEMQTQMGSFLFTNGTAITITDTTLVSAPAP